LDCANINAREDRFHSPRNAAAESGISRGLKRTLALSGRDPPATSMISARWLRRLARKHRPAPVLLDRGRTPCTPAAGWPTIATRSQRFTDIIGSGRDPQRSFHKLVHDGPGYLDGRVLGAPRHGSAHQGRAWTRTTSTACPRSTGPSWAIAVPPRSGFARGIQLARSTIPHMRVSRRRRCGQRNLGVARRQPGNQTAPHPAEGDRTSPVLDRPLPNMRPSHAAPCQSPRPKTIPEGVPGEDASAAPWGSPDARL
jgi:hypothetical protein